MGSQGFVLNPCRICKLGFRGLGFRVCHKGYHKDCDEGYYTLYAFET